MRDIPRSSPTPTTPPSPRTSADIVPETAATGTAALEHLIIELGPDRRG